MAHHDRREAECWSENVETRLFFLEFSVGSNDRKPSDPEVLNGDVGVSFPPHG